MVFGFVGGHIGSYSLNIVDFINLRVEKSHSYGEVDREVLVKAVYDQDYADFCLKQKGYGLFFDGGVHFVEEWTTEQWITNVIERASKSFEYQFGIKLVLVEIEGWDSQGRTSFSLIQELRKEVPLDNCDVVIGFTGKAEDLTCRGEMPHQGHLGNYVIEGFYFPNDWPIQWLKYIFNSYHIQSYTLTHEMGHIFGAVHPEEVVLPPSFPEIGNITDLGKIGSFFAGIGGYIKDTFSIMNAVTGIFTTHFDPYDREIILQNKYLPFK